MPKMLVYHGSYTAIAQPKIIHGKYMKDFGYGFYCTVIKEQAQRWANRFEIPTVNIYELHMNERLSILEFKEMTEDWLDFIVACRNGMPHTHDIVIGSMANDQIYNYISDFVEGIITREQFWTLARFKYPTHQICFCTESALRCLSFVKSEVIEG